VTRRLPKWALALLVAVLATTVGAAAAEAPVGPRLAVVRLTATPPRMEILTLGPGKAPLRLAGGRFDDEVDRPRPMVDFFSPISWAPDGGALAFTGIVAFRSDDDHEPVRRIFLVRPDGSGLRVVPKSRGAQGPIFSPDGHTIAFTRRVEREVTTRVGGKLRKGGFEGSSVWTIDIASGRQRQLTPWREGLDYAAASFSPDGSTLLATYEDDLLVSEAQPVALRLDGSAQRRILDDGSYPVYSPDGSKIALVRRIHEYGEEPAEGSDLFVVDADGTDLRRLTRTPGRSELFPSWDPSGQRLAYVRLSAAPTEAAGLGLGDALMQVNADGTCPTRIAGAPRAAFYTPAWQPGSGREAGRIEC
jgi:TolB protein